MTKSSPIQLLPYYDSGSGQYYLELVKGKFSRLAGSDIKLHLRKSGLSNDSFVGDLNELENALALSQIQRSIDYSGQLAGHKAGVFKTDDGRQVLITKSPALINPKRGKWPFLRRLMSELLAEEREHAFSWLKVAFESLAKGDFRASQVICLAGPAGCGKSLFQAIITAILGGRVGKPYKYMMGDTNFNGDLAESEHWCIEDEHGSTDIRTRRKFGQSIKDVCANTNLFVHCKGSQAITLPTYRRLSMTLNDEAENLQIIPPIDASLADKITLLKCTPADVGDDRKKTWQAITEELPAFLWFLMNEFEIPKDMRCPRYGVKSHQNPILFEALCNDAPEQRLLNIIDEVIFTDKLKAPVILTADELERQIRQSSFGFAVDKLLYFSSACGVYLARLEKKIPSRIESKRDANKRQWIIRANLAA